MAPAMNLPGPPQHLFDRLSDAWNRRAVALKAISYASIGVINVMVDFTVFFIGYGLVGLPLVAAKVVSWSVAVTGSYVMNSYITFARESGRRLKLHAYLTFVAFGIVGLIVNTTTLLVCSWFMAVLGAKVAATLVGFLANFLMSHFIVFPRQKQSAGDAGKKPIHSGRVSGANESRNP
jgi:putative flippase GtrA